MKREFIHSAKMILRLVKEKKKNTNELDFHYVVLSFVQTLPNHVETLKASVEKQQKLVESKTVSTKDREKYDEELKQTKEGQAEHMGSCALDYMCPI